MKTSVREVAGSIDGWRHLESSVDAAVVVIVDVAVNGLDHLTSRLEAVEITQFMLEASVE
jgi:hypothetical protein